MINNLKLMIITTFFMTSIGLLSGCNTVQGFGKDMQCGGQAVENAADKHKPSHS